MPPKGNERRAPCNLYLPVALIDRLQEEADRQDLALSRLVERFLREGLGAGAGEPADPRGWTGPRGMPKPERRGPREEPHRGRGHRARGPRPKPEAGAEDRPRDAFPSRLMDLGANPQYWSARPRVRRQMEVDAAAADRAEGGYAWRPLDPLEEGGGERLNERRAYQAGYRWLDEETDSLWRPEPNDRAGAEAHDPPREPAQPEGESAGEAEGAGQGDA